MSDDFLALFGSATLDDKDDLDPRPSDPGAGDALVLARVVTCIDLQCVVELPDGRKTLVDQVIFDHVAPDSIVPVFRLPEGGWSLVAPHWSLPGRPVASLSFVRGQKVFLEIDAYDEHLDALVGHVEQQRALVPRSLLPWPACSPEMDLTPLIGGGADLIVVNPIGEPIVLGAHTTYLPSGMPLARLYSLQTLSTLAPNISVRVVSVAAQKLTVAYMGQNFTVFREDQGWTKTNSFRDGQLIDARLSVDLKAGRAFISVRRPSDPEWSEVRRRFPLGMIVTRADAVSATGRGFVLDLLDKNFDVFGLVPLHQLGPWKLVSQFEHHSPPLPLQIIGYLEDRCILVLGLAPYITTCWELTRPTVGHQIPLYLSNWNNLPTIAMWGPGCLATCTTNADKEQFAWGMVMESDPLERKLLVSPLGAERRGHRVFAGQNGDAVTFDDGVVGKFAGPLRTRKHSDGLDTTLVAVRFHSNPAVAVVDVRDEHTDRSWAELKRRFRRNESVMASITASMQGGFVGRVYGESLFPELQSDQSSSYGIAVFLPIQNSTFHEQVASDDSVVGKIVEVGIVEWDESAQRCVVSQKMATPKGSLLPGTQRELLAQFHVGDQVVGVINNIVEYGIFVSINGVDGLIHQTDISYEKGEIRKLIIRLGLYIGQEIAAKVIKIDLDKCRLSLGLKQLHPDPWEEFCTQDHIGTCCQGTVTNLVDYGIFLEIAPGIEGLVHFTELTWQIPQPHPSSLFRIGDVVEVRIEDIDFDKRRISLSRNQLSPCVMKAFSTMHPLGAQMTGRIVKFADRGASVVLSPGVKCCLPVTEFAGDTEELKEGDAVRIFLGPMDAKERLMSISFAKRVPRFSDIGTLRQGLIVDGSVSGRDRHDVMIKIHGTEVVGKLSRANLAPFLEGTDNLPDGTGVVVELVSDPSAASDLRMDLRDVMRPERFISLPKKILSPSFQTLSATHALRKDQVYSIYCHVVGENAPVFDEPLTANDFMAMTSALTKSRQKVSLQVLSSLHALNKDQVCTITGRLLVKAFPRLTNRLVPMTLSQ